MFFDITLFLHPKFFGHKIVLDPTVCLAHNFLEITFFRPRKQFGPKIVLDAKLIVDLKFLWKRLLAGRVPANKK